MKQALNTALCAALALTLVACDNTPATKTFSATELFGLQYDIAPIVNADFILTYTSGPADAFQVPFADLGTAVDGLKKFKFEFNSSTKVFTVRILDGMGGTYTTLNMPDYKVRTTLKNGTEVAFSDILTDIVSINAVIDLGPSAVTTEGNCEIRTTSVIDLEVTPESVTLQARGIQSWVDIQSNTLPLVDCRAALNQEKMEVETDAMGADSTLDQLNDLGRINTNKIPQLVSLETSYTIEGSLPAASEEFGAPSDIESAYDLETITGQDGVTLEVRDATSRYILL